MLKPEGVLHFTIPVKDLDRSEKFYTEIMGLEKMRRNDHMVFMRAGADDYFVLTLSEKPVEPNFDKKHDIHHAFRVSGRAYDEALEEKNAQKLAHERAGGSPESFVANLDPLEEEALNPPGSHGMPRQLAASGVAA